MPIEISDAGKIKIREEKDKIMCPKCGNTELKASGCCGHKKWSCTKCEFTAPRRIFVDGLPSKAKLSRKERKELYGDD